MLRWLRLDLWVAMIEMVGALIIAGYCLAALVALARGRGPAAARLLIGQGALTGLGYTLAATLLKTLVLLSWQQIAMFAAIFALRTLLKRLFVWEQGRLGVRAGIPTGAAYSGGVRGATDGEGTQRDPR